MMMLDKRTIVLHLGGGRGPGVCQWKRKSWKSLNMVMNLKALTLNLDNKVHLSMKREDGFPAVLLSHTPTYHPPLCFPGSPSDVLTLEGGLCSGCSVQSFCMTWSNSTATFEMACRCASAWLLNSLWTELSRCVCACVGGDSFVGEGCRAAWT